MGADSDRAIGLDDSAEYYGFEKLAGFLRVITFRGYKLDYYQGAANELCRYLL